MNDPKERAGLDYEKFSLLDCIAKCVPFDVDRDGCSACPRDSSFSFASSHFPDKYFDTVPQFHALIQGVEVTERHHHAFTRTTVIQYLHL